VAQHEQFQGSEAGVPSSRLMDYLPAVYHEVDAADSSSEHLLRHFLLAFEQILLGTEEPTHGKSAERSDRIEGLEHCVARLHTFFDPEETREDFLSWLGSWVALDLRSNLPLSRRRALLSNIVPLYQVRGTKRYLEELLRLYFEAPVVVDDNELPRFQIGVHSSLGRDTYVEGGAPFFFRVRLELSGTEREVENQTRIAREVIDLAKPAHTMYSLQVEHRKDEHH